MNFIIFSNRQVLNTNQTTPTGPAFIDGTDSDRINDLIIAFMDTQVSNINLQNRSTEVLNNNTPINRLKLENAYKNVGADYLRLIAIGATLAFPENIRTKIKQKIY